MGNLFSEDIVPMHEDVGNFVGLWFSPQVLSYGLKKVEINYGQFVSL